MKNNQVLAIFNNQLALFYVSHEEEYQSDFADTVLYLVCGLPNEKIKINQLKNKKSKRPRIYFDKYSVIFLD